MIVIFSGSSGVGKNTVINELLQSYPEYSLMPTFTTREKRPGETVGAPYFFVSKPEFEQMIAASEFYEYQVVHEVNYYGTPKKTVDDIIANGKICLKDIDVLGAMELVRLLNRKVAVITIFFYIDNKDILVDRLKGRGEKDIEQRLKRYDLELSYSRRYSYIINNVNLQQTKQLCRDIIQFERSNGILLATDDSISQKKVDRLVIRLNAGAAVDPIDVAVKDGKIYIIDGQHRYVASLISGKNVAKRVLNSADIKDIDQTNWINTLKSL